VKGLVDGYDPATGLTNSETDDLVTTFAYDALGRIVEEKVWSTYVAAYLANPVGPLTPETPDTDSVWLSWTSYRYDVLGNVTEVRRVAGSDVDDVWNGETDDAVTSYAYDDVGRLVAEAIWEGSAPEPGTPGESWYDEMMSTGSVAGHTPLSLTLYEYDRLDRLTKTTRVAGALDAVVNSTVEPDEHNDLVETIAYHIWEVAATQVGSYVVATDARGGQWTTYVDAVGQVVREIDAAGAQTDYDYDAAGRLTDEYLPEGRRTHYEYDALDRLTELRNVVGEIDDPTGVDNIETDDVVSSMSYSFDTDGTLVVETDAMGEQRMSGYDRNGRLTRVEERDGTITKYEYDAADRLAREIRVLGAEDVSGGPGTGDERDRVTKYAYDISPTGVETETVSYVQGVDDADPNRSTINPADLDDRVVVATYDEFRRVETLDDSQAGLTAYTYRADGLLLSTTVFAVGVLLTTYRQATYAYDDLGRQTSIADSVSGTTTFTFDNRNLRTTLEDAADNTTTWTYDAFGRVVTETDPLAEDRTFTYDGAGNLIRAVDRNGRVVDYRYDEANRRTHEYWYEDTGDAPALPTDVCGWGYNYDDTNALRTFTYTYDEAGRLENAADSGAGSAASASAGVANSYEYDYNTLDQVWQYRAVVAGGYDVTFTQTFDKNGRRTGITDDQGGATTFGFDEMDRMLWASLSTSSTERTRVDWVYDELGRIDHILRSSTAEPDVVLRTKLGFDDFDRLTAIKHDLLDDLGAVIAARAHFDFGYDEFDRIEQITGPAGERNYGYDAANQLTGTTDGSSNVLEDYEYDANGNREGTGIVVEGANRLESHGDFTFLYDAEGNRTRKANIVSGEVIEYSWDHRNRLSGVAIKNAANAVTYQASFDYDINNRLIRRLIDADGDASIAAEIYLSAHDVAAVMPGIGLAIDNLYAEVDAAGNVVTRYLFGPGVDQVLATVSSTNEVRYYATDHLGSVRQVLATDGDVLDQIEYDAFGDIISETAAGERGRLAFTARPIEDAFGGQNSRARWYEAFVGQWLSEDPIQDKSGQYNWRVYVGNGPVDASDPSGLEMYIVVSNILSGRGHATLIVYDPVTQRGSCFDGGGPNLDGTPPRKDHSIIYKMNPAPSNWTGTVTMQDITWDVISVTKINSGKTYLEEITSIVDAYSNMRQIPEYSGPLGPNSNTFLCALLKNAGVNTDAPPKATAWDYNGIFRYGGPRYDANGNLIPPDGAGIYRGLYRGPDGNYYNHKGQRVYTELGTGYPR
jgi:RHS repeat-associated protein